MKLKPVLFCIGITYLLELFYYVFFHRNSPNLLLFFALSAAVMWIPGVVALFFARKEKISLRVFQKPNWMFLKSALFSMGICLISVTLLMPFYSFNSELSLLSMVKILVMGLISGIFINSFFALGEELFWRGYLHEKLKHLRMLKASLIIGSIWGIWHMPLILMGHNYPGHPLVGVLLMCLLCMAVSPIFFFFKERGRSILIPAILHGTFNSFGSLGFLVFQDSNPLFSVAGVAGIITCATISAFFLWREKRVCSV